MNNRSGEVITIDGPSGSGKGTLSHMLARQLNYHLLDSGALYRLVALGAMKRGLNLKDESAIALVALNLNARFTLENSGVQIVLDEEEVTNAIREEAVGMGASQIAAFPNVRSALLERQRAFAQPPGLIADGRDMGTVVFPEARVKIFLTASAEARAERRFKQLQSKGELVDKAVLIADIQERDYRDSTRAISPLKPAEDAVIIDSTNYGIEEVFNNIMAIIRRNIAE